MPAEKIALADLALVYVRLLLSCGKDRRLQKLRLCCQAAGLLRSIGRAAHRTSANTPKTIQARTTVHGIVVEARSTEYSCRTQLQFALPSTKDQLLCEEGLSVPGSIWNGTLRKLGG